MGSMSTIVNHTVLNSWSFLRQCLKCSYQTQKKREQKGKKRNVKKERKWLLCEVMVMLIIWSDHFTSHTYMTTSSRTPNIWTIFNCQIYFKKLFKKGWLDPGRAWSRLFHPRWLLWGSPEILKKKKKDDWKLPIYRFSFKAKN